MKFKGLLVMVCAAGLMVGCNSSNRTSNTIATSDETGTAGTTGSNVSASDRNFVNDMLSDGMAEVELARLAKDRVGAFLVVGIISGFGFQVLYNITMSAGLAPVKGLTLPLMSYGGSSLVAALAGFGLILNVRMRRFAN